MSGDLAAWLLQQITDDETAAKAATTLGYGWDADGLAGDVYASGDDPQTGTVVAECGDHDDAQHIARWDPARVLAECEAKRRIVEMHVQYPTAERPDWSGCSSCGYASFVPDTSPKLRALTVSGPCPVLRLLAAPYADRPGYRDEWRP